MLKSFSLGLREVSREKPISTVVLSTFALGLKPIFSDHNSGKVILRSFAVGLVGGSPTNLRISRPRLLDN